MKKDNKCKRMSALIIIVIMGILMFVYFTFCYIFQTHYFFHTTIDYIESSVQTVDTVSDILKDEFQKYSLHVIGREDTEVTISAKDVSLKVDTQDALQKIMDSQNAWLWPVSIWKEYSYDLEHIGQYHEDALEQIIDTISFMQRDYMKAPQNAYIGDFQESTGQYELVKAYPGTYLRKGKVCDSIKLALENMDTELNLEEAGCYIEPSITSEDKELLRLWTEINKQVSARITYQFGEKEEVVDASLIHNWLFTINHAVYIREDEVKAYVKELADIYNTYGKVRIFKTVSGVEKKLKSGAYGWKMDVEAEQEALLTMLADKKSVAHTPQWTKEGYVTGENDIGSTYVEIDLSAQHLYFIKDGSVIMESPLVSGNMSRGWGTPGGVFGLTYKTRNAVLRGADYATPVSYWMPFNGNIGMHDAGWRGSFGGTIYQTSGSHGCVNLPPNKAKEIYGYVEKNMPVVCYY